jgi:hypothetical protein
VERDVRELLDRFLDDGLITLEPANDVGEEAVFSSPPAPA